MGVAKTRPSTSLLDGPQPDRDDAVETLAALRVLRVAPVIAVPTPLSPTTVDEDPTPRPAQTVSLAAPPLPTSQILLSRLVALIVVLGLFGCLVWWVVQGPGADAAAVPVAATTGETATPNEAPPVVSEQISVPATVAWTDAGVACHPGSSFELVATGIVFHDPSHAVDPDGSPDLALRRYNLPGLPDANHSALVASLDGNAPFTVVGGSATYTCAATGELSLGPNDGGVDNNHGEWTVTVTPSG